MADSIASSLARGMDPSALADNAQLRHYFSDCPRVANNAAANTSGTAYWVYVGFIGATKVFQGITMQETSAGAGAQAAEYCLASSPLAPNRATQVLTPLGATASITDLTAGASQLVRPLAVMNITVQGGTHLWCGFRQAMATTQAGFECLFDDMGQGCILQTAASGVLTGAGPFTGVVPAFAGAALSPYMIATQD